MDEGNGRQPFCITFVKETQSINITLFVSILFEEIEECHRDLHTYNNGGVRTDSDRFLVGTRAKRSSSCRYV